MVKYTELLGTIDSTLDDALKLLEELVNLNTHTNNSAGVNRAQDRIEQFLSQLGLDVARKTVQGRGDLLIARTAESAAKPILLLGHVDTVHPLNSPFTTFVRDGDRITGPGVLDMKGGLVVILWSLYVLKTHDLLRYIPLTVLVNSDEEIGSVGSRSHIEREAEAARAALVFEWGRTQDAIILRRKGVCIYEVTVRGRSAHSGNAHRSGANAIVQLAHTVGLISALTNYDRGLTVNVGLLQGGTAVNTVPDLASARFDVRLEHPEDVEAVRAKLAAIIDEVIVPGTRIELRELSSAPPMAETPESRELFESFRDKAQLANLSYEAYPGVIGGGSDANLTSAVGTPTIDGLGPFGDCAHSDREFVEVPSLTKKIANVVLWLADQTNR
jgi:glutamate carboxypeptidase